ncbi:hypothetical protein OROGR_011201 [Orobanche gracilis]
MGKDIWLSLSEDGNDESHKWLTICKISIGIARGIHHLHTSLEKPVIHGNLKSKNILLDLNHNPYVSDFCLHLLVSPTAGQKMLEFSASQGYKPPEQSDVYSLVVIFLQLLTGKELVDENPAPDQDFYLPSAMRSAILDDRMADLYHPDILVGLSDERRAVVEDVILRYFQLAMACCSPSGVLRPDVKQILESLEEIGKRT